MRFKLKSLLAFGQGLQKSFLLIICSKTNFQVNIGSNTNVSKTRFCFNFSSTFTNPGTKKSGSCFKTTVKRALRPRESAEIKNNLKNAGVCEENLETRRKLVTSTRTSHRTELTSFAENKLF